MTNPFTWLVNNVFWRLIFWWKKRIGWKDFNIVVDAIGTVTALDVNITGAFNDGDVCFNLKLDPGQDVLITAPGGRLTSEDGNGPSLHCEIPPWTRNKFDGTWQQIKVGTRVRVSGRWGFDGVHTNGRPEWKEALYGFFAGFFGRKPNWNQGWFEIHPVESLKILKPGEDLVDSLQLNRGRLTELAGLKKEE